MKAASHLLLLSATAFFLAPLTAPADTTFNNTSNHAYGANIGWINWQGDVSHGAVFGEYFLSGFIYGANVGWINLGDGIPGVGSLPSAAFYSNTLSMDFGVNVLPGAGSLIADLRGFAYGANIGWINFEDTGNPQLDLSTGELSGYAWGANVGWINLGELGVELATTSILTGADGDHDGIADAFEFLHAGNTNQMNASSDQDGDGQLDAEEYAADTDPLDARSGLRITAFTSGNPGLSLNISFTSEPSRLYQIETNTGLGDTWSLLLDNIESDGPVTSQLLPGTTNSARFYRVRAFSPLATSNPTGTFELSPTDASIPVHERIQYTFTWTVPGTLNWHHLDSLQFRIRDGSSTVISVLFDEASQNFSLSNESKPGKGYRAGSSQKLHTAGAILYLAETSVIASGPTGPSVTLVLSLSFKAPTADRTLAVEVAAADDLGNEEEFAPAGILTVTPKR